ncbi:MAG: ferredoxin:glutaredoxin reductase [Actinobacteria bacterium]|nr:ferredoxin:glutaredoxin reductase [Actinomycetota bacterium]
MTAEVSQDKTESYYIKLKKDAQDGGYYLNPDENFTKELARGLLTNEVRYGYQSCPCRLSAGDQEKDRDIICPCDYRDADLNDFGACYCGLYVSEDVFNGRVKLTSIPERRNQGKEEKRKDEATPENYGVNKQQPGSFGSIVSTAGKYPVWRCRVCGYLCARENPPLICPICKAKKDRFERFV